MNITMNLFGIEVMQKLFNWMKQLNNQNMQAHENIKECIEYFAENLCY